MIPGSPGVQALLLRRPVSTIRLGLVAVRRLLARMGNPQHNLAIVHVAGTNGKGSVIAFLEAMLLVARIPVAVFTSPHLIRFNERLRINGLDIADADLDNLLQETLSYDPQEETTFFELTTAAALLYFARAKLFGLHQPGLVLLETGLGGRLDATNVVRPLMSLLTSMGRDHEDYLGTTVAGIALEKAGILKSGVDAVAAPNNREASRLLAGVAHRLGVPLSLAGRDFFHWVPPLEARRQTHWRFEDVHGVMRLPPPGLLGAHQYANGALAVAGAKVLQRLGYPLADGAIKRGIAQARWSGRLECFPGSPPVWLDGAHNPEAIGALVRFLRDPAMGNPKTPTTLIFSVMSNKDAAAMVLMLVPWVKAVFVVVCGGERGRSLEALQALWPASVPSVTPCVTVAQALEGARDSAGEEGRVLVTGSLFLVGEARSLLLLR